MISITKKISKSKKEEDNPDATFFFNKKEAFDLLIDKKSLWHMHKGRKSDSKSVD